MRINGLLMLCIILLLSVGPVGSGDNPLDLENAPKVNKSMPADTVLSNADKLTHEFKVLQENNKYNECIVLTIGVVLSLLVVLYFVTRGRHTTTQIVHASGLVLIVFGTIYVIILSDSDAHITGTMGVLGAMAGYLFGSMGKGMQQNKPVGEE